MPKDREQSGHMMIYLIVALAIMSIFAAVVGQTWVDYVRRENEAEMIFRAKEIARAILRHQQAGGGQPLTDLKLLMEPGPRGEYHLRRLYKDPLVRDGKWGLLFQGPDNSILDPNSPVINQQESLGESGDLRNEGSFESGFATGVQEVGGLPIIGVKSLCKERPFRVRNGIQDYSQWQFTIYAAMQEMQRGPGSTAPGQPLGPGQPGPRQPGGPGGQRNRPPGGR